MVVDLPAPFGPTKPDPERHPVQRLHRAEPLAQSVNLDTRVHGENIAAGRGRAASARGHICTVPV
jgi:hypothetical protein